MTQADFDAMAAAPSHLKRSVRRPPLLPVVHTWKGLEEVELATLEWVDWFSRVRSLEPVGYVPPAEFEEESCAQAAAEDDERLERMSLR